MDIKVTKYTKAKQNGIVIARFSILIPKWGNFFINGMKHFKKNGHEWIGFPDTQYELADGTKKFFAFNGFTERNMIDAFKDQVLKAIEEFVEDSKNISETHQNDII